MTVPDVEDTESTKTIDVLATVHIGERITRIGPLDGSVERALSARFSISEKTRVDVIAKAFNGFADDPIRLRAIDRLGMDEV